MDTLTQYINSTSFQVDIELVMAKFNMADTMTETLKGLVSGILQGTQTRDTFFKAVADRFNMKQAKANDLLNYIQDVLRHKADVYDPKKEAASAAEDIEETAPVQAAPAQPTLNTRAPQNAPTQVFDEQSGETIDRSDLLNDIENPTPSILIPAPKPVAEFLLPGETEVPVAKTPTASTSTPAQKNPVQPTPKASPLERIGGRNYKEGPKPLFAQKLAQPVQLPRQEQSTLKAKPVIPPQPQLTKDGKKIDPYREVVN